MAMGMAMEKVVKNVKTSKKTSVVETGVFFLMYITIRKHKYVLK